MSEPHRHESHPRVVNRLRRAQGHLRGVVEMIEAGRPCLDIAQQLHAVERAIAEAKRTLIHDHIDHCLAAAVTAGAPAGPTDLDAVRAISKYL